MRQPSPAGPKGGGVEAAAREWGRAAAPAGGSRGRGRPARRRTHDRWSTHRRRALHGLSDVRTGGNAGEGVSHVTGGLGDECQLPAK